MFKCFFNAFQEVFNEDISDVDWAQITHVTDWGITEELISTRLGRVLVDQDIDRLKGKFITLLQQEASRDQDQFKGIPGAKDFYDLCLSNVNIMTGLATGAWEESARIKLGAIQISPDACAFSNSNHHKERAQILRQVITELDSNATNPPTDIIYFGDGIWDYKTTQLLGIDFVGIDYKRNGKLLAAGAQTVFYDYNDASDFLKSVIT